MIKKVKRETFPIKSNVYDSNWNLGIMIGNIIIFTKTRKEVIKIESIYQHENDTHGFYIKVKGENELKIIYLGD